MEQFTGWRWNGAAWNRLELAKSGPFPSRCVVGSGFRRLIGGCGLAGMMLSSGSVLLFGCRVGLQCVKLAHQPGGLFRGISFTGSAQGKELDHIQPALTQFQTANQAAFAVEFCGQLSLRESRFGAQGHEHFANALALTGINGFVHARAVRQK